MKKTLFILFFIFSSCQFDKTDQPEIARIALESEPPTLDWNIATDNASYQVLNQLMEGLTQYDNNLNVIPAIATRWTISNDGKTYTFYINPKYRWSDGVPVSAQHFKDSWMRLLSPETAAEYAYFLYDIKGAKDFNEGHIKDPRQVAIHVLNPLTLEVELNNPISFFPAITTFMVTFPIRLDVIEKNKNYWTKPEHLVTIGPYKLDSWWTDYRLILSTNPYYGGSPQPYLQQLKFYVIKDPATALNLYTTHQIDVIVPPPLTLEHFLSNPNLIQKTKLRGYYYGFNTSAPPFNNVDLRKALTLALNRNHLPDILKGGEQATQSWIPPGLLGHNNTIGLAFNPEEAKKLLKASGFDPAKKITLSYNSDALNKTVAQWAQAQWNKNLGLKVELDNREWKTYLSLLKNQPPDIFRLGWGADYPDPDNFMNLFTSWSGNNHTGWKNSTYDQLVLEGAKEPSPEKRKKIYDQAQHILLEDDCIIIPLFISSQNILIRDHLKPFPLLPVDFVYYKRVGQPQ